MSRRWLSVAIVWAGLAAWFFVPLPEPKPLTTVSADRGPAPSSLTDTLHFQFPSDSPEATLRVRTDLGQGDIQVELLDASGKGLVRWNPWSGRGNQRFTFTVGGGFRAGTDYQLRVTERNVVGTYRASFADREGVTRQRRFLVLMVVIVVGSGGALVRLRLSPRWPARRRQAMGVLWLPLLTSLGPIYLILHEGGHALALLVFGALDLGRSDMLGLRSNPHVGILMGAKLADWQRAVLATSGPGLPMLIGWMLLALGVTPVGRRIRARRLALDLFLSLAAALFLFTGVALPAQALGILNPDGDFRGFVENVALPIWGARAILGAVGLLSFAASLTVAKHAVRLVRSMRRAQQTTAETGSSGGPPATATATGDTALGV